jgi:putative DNA-invertase from lambdoid prophage Rac
MVQTIIYARVSTNDQNCDRQISELTAYCQRSGHQIVGVYRETASGSKRDRAVRGEVMQLARQHRCDAILVWELSRWSRSTIDLLETLQQLKDWGVSLLTLNGFEMDLSTPQGKLIVSILGAIAEFERELICDRVRSGLAAAKARGKRFGRQKGLTPKVKRLIPKIEEFKAEGRSLRWMAKELQISKTTIQKVLTTVG